MSLSPATVRKLNALAALLWAACVPIGLYLGWQESIPFLFFASVYANFVGHLSAERADVPDPEIISKLEAIQKRLDTYETRDRSGG